MISETTEQSAITTDFSGQMVKSVQIQLVPAGDKTSIIVRDVDIETCIGNGDFFPFLLILCLHSHKFNLLMQWEGVSFTTALY